VAADGDGDLLLDQRAGIGVSQVDALAWLPMEERFGELDKHGSHSRRATDGVKNHDRSVRLQATGRPSVDGLVSVSTACPDGLSPRTIPKFSTPWGEQFSDFVLFFFFDG